MRILFFIDSLRSGGKERRLIELMKGLRSKPGIEFEVVVMSNEVHYKEVYDLGIRIHHIIRKTKKDLSVFYKFYKICKQYKPDFVHCWDGMTAIYLIPTSVLLPGKFINGLVTNTPAQQNIFNKRWLRAKLTFPFSNIILGNSEAGLAAYNAPKKKSVCIHNGFNFQRTNSILKDDKVRDQINIRTNYVIGMVASFSNVKDYPTYYSAAQLLLKKRNDITFLAIGSDTDSMDSKNLINDIFIDNFRLLGKQSGVESFINTMDICVLSTFTEGISNAILEYMALGKTVIATSGGGTNEIVKDQVTGFLISPSNPKELAEKMEILLNDEGLRNRMGQAGKERVHSFFSIDKMVDTYVEVCNKSLLN